MTDRRFVLYKRRSTQPTARRLDELSRRFTVTHPFHPLRGRAFDVADFRSSWGKEWVSFYGDDGFLRAIPVQWTNAASSDPFVEQAAGRAHFRLADLLELADLVTGRAPAARPAAGPNENSVKPNTPPVSVK